MRFSPGTNRGTQVSHTYMTPAKSRILRISGEFVAWIALTFGSSDEDVKISKDYHCSYHVYMREII